MTACSQPELLTYKATLTDGIFLLIPGLLAPQAMYSTPLEAASIGRFLSRSVENTLNSIRVSTGTSVSLESMVARWFNASSVSEMQVSRTQQLSAAARMGYQAEISADGAQAEVYCINPVYQQMDINHATLADQALLNLTAEDSAALIATLNQQFGSDGLTFESTHPLRWYCQFENAFDRAMNLETVSLSSATGRDVSLCRPAGVGARRWRALLAEIEMILFSHPVNQQREARGEMPVNSVWIWGGGQLPNKIDTTGTVYTNNFYARSYADHCGVQVRGIVDFTCDELPALLVDDRLATAAAMADCELRKQVVNELADLVFAQLEQTRGVFKRGGAVSLWCGGNRVWYFPERIAFRDWLTGLYKLRTFESFIELQSNDYCRTETSSKDGKVTGNTWGVKGGRISGGGTKTQLAGANRPATAFIDLRLDGVGVNSLKLNDPSGC